MRVQGCLPIPPLRLLKKGDVPEKRIPTPEQTAQVLALIDHSNRLICTTIDYTIIGMKRHDKLTRRIQQMRERAARKTELAGAQPATDLLRQQRERAKAPRAARKERHDKVVEIKSKETAP